MIKRPINYNVTSMTQFLIWDLFVTVIHYSYKIFHPKNSQVIMALKRKVSKLLNRSKTKNKQTDTVVASVDVEQEYSYKSDSQLPSFHDYTTDPLTYSDPFSANSESTDYYRSGRKKAKSNDHLQLQLHINHLLTQKDRNNDEFINQCIDKIGEQVFNGKYGLFEILIRNVPLIEDLKEIYEIVKNIKLSQDETKEDKEKDSKPNPFNLLSTESISNICSFLSRADLSKLKIVSYDVGVVALQQMTRYSFGVCNLSKFIKYPSLMYDNHNHRYLEAEINDNTIYCGT